MFNSKESKKPQQTISNNSQVTSKVATLLGAETHINGDINFSGMLHLDGKITGSIVGSNTEDVLTISETGVVDGKIQVSNIVINGSVKGDIIATGKIEVASKANVEGNVYYQNIQMDTGSKINGQLIYQSSDAKNKISKIDDKRAK